MSDSTDQNEMDAEFEQSGKSLVAENSAISITTLVYALQALSFLVGITFFAAVIINYVKRADVEGSWLESHFRWQMRTFWFAVLWSVIGFISWIFLIGWIILGINAIWIIYRVVRGWINLAERKPMYT